MQIKEKLILTKEQARLIVWGDNPDFEKVYNKIIDSNRWSKIKEIVVKRKSDGKFFKDVYQVGATECQDEGPYDYTDPAFTEVFPVEKKVIIYE
jgi:hypothetical protein